MYIFCLSHQNSDARVSFHRAAVKRKDEKKANQVQATSGKKRLEGDSRLEDYAAICFWILVSFFPSLCFQNLTFFFRSEKHGISNGPRGLMKTH